MLVIRYNKQLYLWAMEAGDLTALVGDLEASRDVADRPALAERIQSVFVQAGATFRDYLEAAPCLTQGIDEASAALRNSLEKHSTIAHEATLTPTTSSFARLAMLR